MDIRSQAFSSIEQVRDNLTNATSQAKSNGVTSTAKRSFGEVLQQVENQTNESITFSKHASERLKMRNISMSDSQIARLDDATSQANAKGMKESLVMVDNLAFIVNVKNRTVVTAVNDLKQGVFTNIDGAVIN